MTVTQAPPASLAEIYQDARPYPADLLPQCGTGLALFAAGFWGWNDAIHLAAADLTLTCVDTDKDKLMEMAILYPAASSFYAMDCWEFVGEFASDEEWDVVTVDPWRPMIDEVLRTLPLWCSAARQLVTIGCFIDGYRPPIPDGWRASIFPRTEQIGWLVLTR